MLVFSSLTVYAYILIIIHVCNMYAYILTLTVHGHKGQEKISAYEVQS